MANENRERIRDLTGQGLSVREVAKLLDMSTQGVYWHLRKLRSAKVACDVTGVTYRMLDYVARTGLITPTVAAAGSGSQRGYSVDDIVWLHVYRTLADWNGRAGSQTVLRRLRSDGRFEQGGLSVDVDLPLIRAGVIRALQNVPSQERPDPRLTAGRRSLPPQLARAVST